MARSRNIKPGFFDNDELGLLTPLTRLLFIGLWCIADREGRLEDRPRRIKKTLLGYDELTVEEADGMLQQLADHGFITRYTAEGTEYIQINKFSKHQNPHRAEKASEIPPPPGYNAEADKPQKKAEKKTLSSVEFQLDQFEEFWSVYPNHKARASAEREWVKINPDKELTGQIIAAVTAAAKTESWLKDNGKYIPFAANYLKDRRWEDQQEPEKFSSADALDSIINGEEETP
ncbi:MAG: hypothetical protein ACI4HO_08905 [Ruminococcus sp.]